MGKIRNVSYFAYCNCTLKNPLLTVSRQNEPLDK